LQSGDVSFIKMSTIELETSASIDPGSNTQLFWQFRKSAVPTFDKRIFDEAWLSSEGHITNSPSAGRGGSHFLQVDSYPLVLRRYRRGGMARSVSDNKYLWQGLKRTRAWREFAVLAKLEEIGLNAPRHYACKVRRLGAVYTATLITHFLPGVTLAEKLFESKLEQPVWQSIGHCIRQFHEAGVNHADLNAHNILLDEQRNVSLIDFDRAVISRSMSKKASTKNLKRLQRSLHKISSSGPLNYDSACWDALWAGYHNM